MRRYGRAAPILLTLVVAVPWLGGCGSSGDSRTGRGPIGITGSTVPGRGTGLETTIARYEERCRRLDRRGALAHVVFRPRQQMTRGQTERIAAEVTLKPIARLRPLLVRGLTAEPGIVVSCLLQARLTAIPGQFRVNDERWIERSLLEADTARWSWFVTPRVGGRYPLVLSFRPIVRLSGRDEAIVHAEDATVLQYAVDVDVKLPPGEQELTTVRHLTKVTKEATSFIDALKGLLIALIALGAVVVGVWRHRRRRAERS